MRLNEEFRTRTKQYASAVIKLYVTLPRARREVQVLGQQLLRSGTSVASHCREASRARSNVDAALQEADESGLWLELLRDDCGIGVANVNPLLNETNELISIFVSIVEKTKRRNK